MEEPFRQLFRDTPNKPHWLAKSICGTAPGSFVAVAAPMCRQQKGWRAAARETASQIRSENGREGESTRWRETVPFVIGRPLKYRPVGWCCADRAVRLNAPRQFERHTVRRPQRDRQPQTSPAVGRDLHRPGVRLQQRIVYEPHSGVHADNQRKQHRSEKAISGAGRNGVLPRNIELTLFRAQQIQ